MSRGRESVRESCFGTVGKDMVTAETKGRGRRNECEKETERDGGTRLVCK